MLVFVAIGVVVTVELGAWDVDVTVEAAVIESADEVKMEVGCDQGRRVKGKGIWNRHVLLSAVRFILNFCLNKGILTNSGIFGP